MQLFVSRFQLPVGHLELGLQLPGPGDVAEIERDADVRAVSSADRHELDVEKEALGRPARRLDLADPCRSPLGEHLVDMGAQLDRPIGHLEVAERSPDVARAQPEERIGWLVAEHQLSFGIDEQRRDRAGHQAFRPKRRQVARVPGEVGDAAAERRSHSVDDRPRHLAEEPPLEVDGLEQLGV